MFTLPGTELANIKKIKSDKNSAAFNIEPLLPGYGMTIGNALRRVLLTSLPGSAITWVKIPGASHEFSTLPGVKEDVVDIILNLKGLKVKLHGDEPVKIKLVKKGPGKVTAKDFAKNAQIEIADQNYYIATLSKGGKLEIEANIENGRGYITIEQRKDEKLPLGIIAIDSIFTPMKKVHYAVEHTRVGGMTNYDKLTIDLTTDGTIDPVAAIHTAAKILAEHFQIVVDIKKEDKAKEKKVKPKKTKTTPASKTKIKAKPKKTVEEKSKKKTKTRK